MQIPRGCWKHLLFGVLIVSALKYDVKFDIMVTSILSGATETKKFVTNDPSSGSPLDFSHIEPAEELLDAIGMTTNVNIKEKTKDVYRVPVSHNVVGAAKALCQIMTNNYFEDTRPLDTPIYKHNKKIYIDFTGLRFKDGMSFSTLVKNVIEKEKFFEGYEKFPNTSWANIIRLFNAGFPRNGNSLKNAEFQKGHEEMFSQSIYDGGRNHGKNARKKNIIMPRAIFHNDAMT
jgi:hypothetical protein